MHSFIAWEWGNINNFTNQKKHKKDEKLYYIDINMLLQEREGENINFQKRNWQTGNSIYNLYHKGLIILIYDMKCSWFLKWDKYMNIEKEMQMAKMLDLFYNKGSAY